MSKYKLDYFSKYYFYEEDDFIKREEEGEYILDQIRKSNRFDYKGYTYKYTKFGNISKGDTQRDVEIEITENSPNVIINGEIAHLDLIYKIQSYFAYYPIFLVDIVYFSLFLIVILNHLL